METLGRLISGDSTASFQIGTYIVGIQVNDPAIIRVANFLSTINGIVERSMQTFYPETNTKNAFNYLTQKLL